MDVGTLHAKGTLVTDGPPQRWLGLLYDNVNYVDYNYVKDSLASQTHFEGNGGSENHANMKCTEIFIRDRFLII